MKKIVVKMRSFKKLFGGDLLQLALLLSLLKVDPDNYLGYSPHSGQDPEADYSPGPAMLQDMWTHNGLSPRIHPKSMDSLLELHQAEILEDLNSLGRYSRLSHYSGVPVHISAYILDTDHASPQSCNRHNDGTESDSGISDTNHDSDQESTADHDDTEKEKAGEDVDMDVDMECETILTNIANPSDVLGLDAIVGLTPPPEDQDLLAYTTGQDALEAELVHIDEQLMHIEDDLGHIDEQFIMMDQQLAETISDDYDTEAYSNAMASSQVDLDTIDIVGNNPFDDWQREALADLNDLVLDNVENEAISIAAPRNIKQEEFQEGKSEESSQEEILQDPDLFPTDQTQSGSTLLEDFDEDLLDSKFIRNDLDKIVKQDVVLPQMSSLQSNSSQPFRSLASASLLDHESHSEETFNLTEAEVVSSSKESSVDRDLMEEINVDVDEDDEDIIMQVLRESNINFDEIPIDIDGLKLEEDVKLEEEIKLEDIKEEVIEVEDIGYQVSIVDGAAAKADIDYNQLHDDIKAKFQETDDGYSFAELTLGSQFSDAYNPGFNSRAFENDHSYGVTTKLEQDLLEPTTSRRRNVSESSGYSSMTEDFSSSRCRDEIKAKKMKLPFLVHDIINSPVDLFNEMLVRPGLSSEQIQLCKDIRRRGKNKVAAQNCRKRKMDTIEELQHQVDQVRRRREQLLRAREELEAERARWSSKLSYLEESVLHGIGKELGMFTLEVRDDTVVVTSTARLLAAGGAEKSPRSQN